MPTPDPLSLSSKYFDKEKHKTWEISLLFNKVPTFGWRETMKQSLWFVVYADTVQ